MKYLSRSSSSLTAALFLLLLWMAPAMLHAQSARVSGEITDPQGRAVAGAHVSVRNEATGVHRETRSTDAGVYGVTAIDPGRYTVRVVMQGFNTVEHRGLELFVDTETRVDFQLKVGDARDTVTVTSEASLLQPNTAENATEITSQQYNELPLLQQGRYRSPAAFIFLAPGVQGNYTVTGAENTAATNQFVINGSQMQVTEFFLEGAQVGQMRTVGNFNESAPTVDAVREFKITTTLLPSEYGHSGPAAGIFSIRSGTNRYHGSIYEYIRNDYFDAKPWGAVIHTFTRLNEFGATLGGPLTLPHIYNGHNRTFFFFSYGGGRKSASDSIQNIRVPTQDQIHGIFDPVKYFGIFDPETTRPDPSTTNGTIRDQFPSNTIQPSRIDPAAKIIASYFPIPNLPNNGTKDYQAIIGELMLNPNIYTVKIDHQLSPAHHLSATYVQSTIPRNKVGTGLPFPLRSDTHQTTKAKTARLNYDWTLSPQIVNALVLGFNRFGNAEIPPTGNYFSIPGLPTNYLPYISFTQSYPDIANDGNFNDVENNYQGRDVLRWNIARHSFSFGGELRNIQFNDSTPTVPSTTIKISDLETNDPAATPRTGDAFASFLLGQVDSASIVNPYEIATRFRYAGFFAQDDWKIMPRLTLNLGLRWEFQTFPTESRNHSSILDLNTPNPGAIGPGGVPIMGALIFAGTGLSGRSAFGATRYDAVSPRFGFAFQVAPNIVVRGGYGIFYANTGTTISSFGFQSQGNVQSPDAGLHPAFTLQGGFPSIASLQPVLSPTLLNPSGTNSFQNASYYDPAAGAMPRIQEWTASIQQSFGKNWMAEMDYVGNKGSRLIDPAGVEINQLNPKYLSLGSTLLSDAGSLAGSTQTLATGEKVLIKLPYQGFVGTVFQSLRPFPQYNNLTSLAAKVGYNSYNSLQLVLHKRYSYGLTMDGNYVWSKNLGNSSPGAYGGGVVDNATQDAYNPGPERSILPIDVSQAFIFHYTYELPFGRGKRWLNHSAVQDAFLGGWKLSGVQRYQTGYPLPIFVTNSLGIGNRVLRPNIVPGVDPATHAPVDANRLINPLAFVAPPAFQFGNARPTYGSVRNFPILNEDFSLVKGTQLGRRVTWNLYLQTFNTFNRHRFTAIDTNASNAATTFGQGSVPSQPRYVQLGTRFTY